ncbi:MAG TPA: hypothetical protein VE909_12610 [Xanthobacteraceae bacterium]|nr:hypothetical protein [Xanthobacteraceae bacterium]
MIEMIMYFGIGFLCASLLGIVIIPLVHNRAARLTVRRLEAATPLSVAEIQADKDQLRAEFAMSTRRLEMNLEQLKAQSTGHLSDLGRKTEAIAILKHQLEEKAAAIDELESRGRELWEQLGAVEKEHFAKSTSLQETEIALADRATSLATLTAELRERAMDNDSLKAEISALTMHVHALETQLERHERDAKDTIETLSHERRLGDMASTELVEERGKVESLSTHVAELERALIAQTTEAEILSRRLHDLEARLAEQGRALAEREHALAQMHSEVAEFAPAGTARADTARLEAQLAQVSEERSRLQEEVAALKRDAESTWASERVENTRLRDQINDIAAEVARLTMALEGPDSPIEAILATETPTAGNGTGTGSDGGERGKGDLAARIRALQSRTSRATTVP